MRERFAQFGETDMRACFSTKRILRTGAAILTAALVFAAYCGMGDAFAKSPKREGGLRKSTEGLEPRPSTVPASAKKPVQSRAKPDSPAAVKPSAKTPPPPAPAPANVPKPQPKPEPPKKSSDPVERAREELAEARDAIAKGKNLEGFRQASAVANEIKKKEYDRLGVDGAGTKAEDFRQIFIEALKIAEEGGNKLRAPSSRAQKTLTFYF